MNLTGPILVFGASGQVGRALLKILGHHGIGFFSSQADFKNFSTLFDLLKKSSPSAVINAAAYTAVDLAETHESLATEINGKTPGLIAQWCTQEQIPFIHYSTDYVFSGEGSHPWQENSPVGPLNAYGRSKLEGEIQVQSAGGNFLIFRTSWVYDGIGKNFLTTMLKLGKSKKTLEIVNDQWGAPTYAGHLAQATLQCLSSALLSNSFPSGIYHLCNDGETNWLNFAHTIFQMATQKGLPLVIEQVYGISSSDYPTPAKRPLNSRLNLDKTQNTLGVRLPHWKVGLKECLESIGGNSNESHSS